MSDQAKTKGRSLSLTTGGITVLGVLVSVGVTVAFGLKGESWVPALAGVATTVVLPSWSRSPLRPVADRWHEWRTGSSGQRMMSEICVVGGPVTRRRASCRLPT